MKNSLLVIASLALFIAVVVAQEPVLKPTTPRISVVAYETTRSGSVEYSLKKDNIGGTCWWEVMIDTGSGILIYAVPVVSTACLVTP